MQKEEVDETVQKEEVDETVQKEEEHQLKETPEHISEHIEL